jgi:hypothetical protein
MATPSKTAAKSTRTRKPRASSKGNGSKAAAKPSKPEADEDGITQQQYDEANAATEANDAAAAATEGGNGEDETAQKGWKENRRKPKHIQHAILINNMRNRVHAYGETTRPWEQEALTTAYSEAVEALDKVVDVLEAMPEDFVPPRAARRRTASKVEVGARIDIRPKHQEKYQGIVEDEDLTNLEVMLVASGCVKVYLNSERDEDGNPPEKGGHIVLPRGQVMAHRPPKDDDAAADDE